MTAPDLSLMVLLGQDATTTSWRLPSHQSLRFDGQRVARIHMHKKLRETSLADPRLLAPLERR